MASVEIEKRVALTAEQAQATIELLDARGVEWDINERLMMDFSGSLENRETQVMVRVNNGIPELSIKKGGVGDTVRREASVYSSGGVGDMLDAVALLGYVHAKFGLRSMKTCVIDNLEYSFRFIRDITNPELILGVNFEIEALGNATEKDIDVAIDSFGLTPLSDAETKSFFTRIHKEADAEYQHSEAQKEHIEQLIIKWAS